MNKDKLTPEQQAAAFVLSDEIGAIHTQIERVKRLSVDIQTGYFDKEPLARALKEGKLSPKERISNMTFLVWDYDVYRVYSELLADLACDLETMVNDLWC